MSNYLAIATVSTALVRRLQSTLNHDLSGLDAQAKLVRPGDKKGNPPAVGVGIFLYQVTPNEAWRNHDQPARAPDGRVVRRPRVALNLYYLLTFYGAEKDLEPQKVLGSVVSTMNTHPVLDREMVEQTIISTPTLSGADLHHEIELVRFAPLALSLDELSRLWGMFFETTYQLSLSYEASVVLIERKTKVEASGRVLHRPEPPAYASIEAALASVDTSPLISPDDLPGLQLWLRADADVTAGAEGLIEWADRSGNGHDAFQTDDAGRPAYVQEGIAALRFDGVDDVAAIRALKYDSAFDELTVAALVRTARTDEQVIASFDGEHYWEIRVRNGFDEAEHNIAWVTAGSDGTTHTLGYSQAVVPAYGDGEWNLVIAWFKRGEDPDKRIFINGVEVAGENGHGGLALGSGTVNRFGFLGASSQASSEDGSIRASGLLGGDLAELMIFHRALTDAEREDLTRYMFDRYGSG